MPPEENPADNEQITEEEFNNIEQPVEEVKPLGILGPNPGDPDWGQRDEILKAMAVPQEIIDNEPKSNYTGAEGFRMPGKPNGQT